MLQRWRQYISHREFIYKKHLEYILKENKPKEIDSKSLYQLINQSINQSDQNSFVIAKLLTVFFLFFFIFLGQIVTQESMGRGAL